MNKYKDKTKQEKMQEIMLNSKQVSFKVLQQLERDGIIEDYDTFTVTSDFKDLLVFYLDGEYNLIDTIKKDFRPVPNKLLQDRYFILSRSITNNVQGYLQKYGTEAFNKLSTKEFIDVMLSQKDSLISKGEER